MYIKGKYVRFEDKEICEIMEIRKKVFQEEQGVPEELEQDGIDKLAIHAAAYRIEVDGNSDEKKIVATGRLVFDGDTYKIGRVAVLKEERGKNYGDFIVKILLQKAFINGAKEVYVNSQENAVNFYKKIGFIECSEPYIEIGKKHITMKITENKICKKCHDINIEKHL